MLNYLIVDELIRRALEEDMPFGDITTDTIINEKAESKASVIVKEDGIICGVSVFDRVYKILGDVDTRFTVKDGQRVSKNDVIGSVSGNTRNILIGERIALNLMQRMSGIATTTNKYSEKIKNFKTQIVDTRKVTPLYRHLDKYSVKCGGGANHRFSLSDAVLIKDNHISAAGGVKEAINLARKNCSFTSKIEVETENSMQVLEALEAKADIIMLDNMTPKEVAEMVEFIDGRAIVECSGNITIDNIEEYGRAGADFISCGALTHSFKILDISLKNLINL
ncbi:MAG: carboxylating nicotinate-nucleotide diphosphorylase [Inconstantimicrobium porci]|uniref:carboxylating nicotinate-nucleotide diphosphorylase n=1 Tax=Inconstantimicrobium porci TaxID=2652291 RepID=UPI002A91235C|nr:carboxylating nicotinate-nucleotide diphosphorylase [Inconstantimicrobium porci]MDY5912536.1 carboxylating nicotinate-nucleotide diphosphorylase [Inconstantimicrobium porci]